MEKYLFIPDGGSRFILFNQKMEETNKNLSEDKQNLDPEKSNEKQDLKKEKTFTQEEFDKTFSIRLQKEKARMEKEAEEKIAEVQRMAKLSEEEREKELKAKHESELTQREKDIAVRENKLKAIDLFTQNEVPIDLVDYVVTDDSEKTLENGEKFIKAFQDAIAKAVESHLKGSAPKDVNSEDDPVKSPVSFVF